VQWMTAAGGIIHEEFHSAGFSKTGGPFHMVQLWVNLPARHKMTSPKYQAITSAGIPVVSFEGGCARVIAGDFDGTLGPASTFTPINMWDVRLDADAEITLNLPEGHNAMIVVLAGHVTIDGKRLGASEIARFPVEGTGARIKADGDSTLLVLTGEPIDEPVVGYGPFVMTSEADIRTAIDDFNSGRFGAIAA
jgi:redox-sensitive bicupin YhaK (pirin superfamily)